MTNSPWTRHTVIGGVVLVGLWFITRPRKPAPSTTMPYEQTRVPIVNGQPYFNLNFEVKGGDTSYTSELTPDNRTAMYFEAPAGDFIDWSTNNISLTGGAVFSPSFNVSGNVFNTLSTEYIPLFGFISTRTSYTNIPLPFGPSIYGIN